MTNISVLLAPFFELLCIPMHMSILQISPLTFIISGLSLLKGITSGWKETTILTKVVWISRKRETGQIPSCIGEEKDCAEE